MATGNRGNQGRTRKMYHFGIVNSPSDENEVLWFIEFLKHGMDNNNLLFSTAGEGGDNTEQNNLELINQTIRDCCVVIFYATPRFADSAFARGQAELGVIQDLFNDTNVTFMVMNVCPTKDDYFELMGRSTPTDVLAKRFKPTHFTKIRDQYLANYSGTESDTDDFIDNIPKIAKDSNTNRFFKKMKNILGDAKNKWIARPSTEECASRSRDDIYPFPVAETGYDPACNIGMDGPAGGINDPKTIPVPGHCASSSHPVRGEGLVAQEPVAQEPGQQGAIGGLLVTNTPHLQTKTSDVPLPVQLSAGNEKLTQELPRKGPNPNSSSTQESIIAFSPGDPTHRPDMEMQVGQAQRGGIAHTSNLAAGRAQAEGTGARTLHISEICSAGPVSSESDQNSLSLHLGSLHIDSAKETQSHGVAYVNGYDNSANSPAVDIVPSHGLPQQDLSIDGIESLALVGGDDQEAGGENTLGAVRCNGTQQVVSPCTDISPLGATSLHTDSVLDSDNNYQHTEEPNPGAVRTIGDGPSHSPGNFTTVQSESLPLTSGQIPSVENSEGQPNMLESADIESVHAITHSYMEPGDENDIPGTVSTNLESANGGSLHPQS